MLFLKKGSFENKIEKYLFIGGCARSGTSAFTRIIGSHKKIVLGMERYNKLCHKDQYSLKKEHFFKERFFDVQPGDTFYTDFNALHKNHKSIHKKFDNHQYIGTKYTSIHNIIDELNSSFENLTILYIYRNIFDVALSWDKRAEKGNNWPKNKNYIEAVTEWNNSLSTIKDFIDLGQNIFCVNYKDVFFTHKSLAPIYKILNIKLDFNSRLKIILSRRNAKKIKKNKIGLNSEEKKYVMENANFSLYDYFNNYLNILR